MSILDCHNGTGSNCSSFNSSDTLNETEQSNEFEDYYDTAYNLAYEDVKYIFRNYNILLWILGVPSNALIIALIVSMKRIGAASFLIIYLSVMDSLTLTAYLVQRQLYYTDHQKTTWSCRFYHSAGLSFAGVANWTLVLITVERFLSVCYPFRRQLLISKNFFIISVGILSIVLTLVIFTMEALTADASEGVCQEHDDEHLLEIARVLIIYAIPFFFIAIFTAAVLRKISSSSKRRASITSLQIKPCSTKNGGPENGHTTMTSIQMIETSLSQLMLAAAFLYLALNILYCVEALVLKQIYQHNKSRRLHHLDFACRIIRDWNHALNLYVYLAFSKGFRLNFRKLFRFNDRAFGSFRRASSSSTGGHTTVSSTKTTSENTETVH
ncbi:proteinase-activated receptor 1-like [Biomphalaria glabrata]|uniref:Proteinase-activated receptor 1-like n=2 Tax=Biomphalaria glabrata TaxID=6526 RepID=A0A9U8EF23_BIOGL|nr:proteinase-activated receptor 1-like [Biomphalaria glabrata]XP_055860450.1 proteinase-activated receptor 1-like [Biomphalaria glabrata]